MADLVLRILGDYAAGDAMEATKDAIQEVGHLLVDFAKESVAAFEKQETANRRLAAVAGELSDVFERQAQALQDTLGVSDDMVKKMDTMLLQFGEAPAEVDKTVRALLDYSARTGVDAVGATEALLSSAKSGRVAFKELNLEYDKTTSATANVVNISTALGKVVGGSAASEADSLAGRTRKLKEEWEDVQKAFGEFIATIEAKFGVLDKLKGGLRDLVDGVSVLATFFGSINLNSSWSQLGDAWNKASSVKQSWNARDVDAATAASDRSRLAAGGPGRPGGTVGRGGGAGSADARRQENVAEVYGSIGAVNDASHNAIAEAMGSADFGAEYSVSKVGAGENTGFIQKQMDADERMHQLQLKGQEKFEEQRLKVIEQGQKKQLESVKEQEKKWEAAAGAIGTAFVNALGDALKTLAGGGQVDAGELVGDILSGMMSAAAGILSAIPGWGGIAGAVLGIGGSLVKMGTRKKKHGGGWEGLPRYHDGAWPGLDAGEVPAVLEEGERVLSKQEVGQMGGPGAVDAAASGGGRVVLNVQAIDALGVRDFFADDGGRGFSRAIRTGRGDAARLFGAGKVY